MLNEQAIIEKHIKRTTLWSNSMSLIIALFTALTIGYGFYYSTKSTLEEHSKDIKEVKENVKIIDEKMNVDDIYKGVSQTEIKDLKSKVDKMDEKLDKILIEVGKR
jgi:hypothetical protein